MKYHARIQRMLNESGYSLKEIAQICAEKGFSITPSYLSKLKNGQQNPASDEVHFVLADICKEDPYVVLFEAYYEKAPDWLKSLWDGLDKKFKELFLKELEGSPDTIQSWAKEGIDRIELYESLNRFLHKTSMDPPQREELVFPLKGDHMIPLLYPGDQLILDMESSPKEGDVVCLCEKDGTIHTGRYIQGEKQILLVPQNPNQTVEYISTEDVLWNYKIQNFVRQLG